MPGIVIDGNNCSTSGWLAALLGMPRQPEWLEALKISDQNDWYRGYDSYRDFHDVETLMHLAKLGHIEITWEDT